MKLYDITIHPLSAFGTPLKGDTLFGQVCWQVAYDPGLVDGGLEKTLDRYGESPFLVVSSAYPKLKSPGGMSFYAFKKPDLPFDTLFPELKGNLRKQVEERKIIKSKKWMRISPDLTIDLKKLEFISDAELIDSELKNKEKNITVIEKTATGETLVKFFAQPHNAINRLTGTTGGGGQFAPYQMDLFAYPSGTEFSIFVLLDEKVTDISRVVEGFSRIGRYGYGKDASIGKGRFEIQGNIELNLPMPSSANALYCLAPCVPKAGSYTDSFYQPFVRFGRHGDRVASSSQPFKNPVIMADEGAVFLPTEKDDLTRGYFGSGITGVSKQQPKAVAQGYAVSLPLNVEV